MNDWLWVSLPLLKPTKNIKMFMCFTIMARQRLLFRFLFHFSFSIFFFVFTSVLVFTIWEILQWNNVETVLDGRVHNVPIHITAIMSTLASRNSIRIFQPWNKHLWTYTLSQPIPLLTLPLRKHLSYYRTDKHFSNSTNIFFFFSFSSTSTSSFFLTQLY